MGNPHGEALSSNGRSRPASPEDGNGRPARLIGDARPGGSRRPPAVCKSGQNCNWKPRCRFGHPEGGNMDTNNVKEAPQDWEGGQGNQPTLAPGKRTSRKETEDDG